ncbi:hypothetical protein [Stenotrophomonas sp. NLF4-10]|uniref:hypothetical protein n=1 Tax=Stenotrophomonas sp. NLF4-10 TaxID=2918754 RepID=UPI001EFB06FF|nr:hypothetical protein [Stenotrophomonas sp. NLF4-10]MCG8277904.1 hypothetical protein [Stenotrophomonas sp. NLF4-10]
MADLRGLQQLRSQWQATPRLRYGVMVIAAILGLQVLFMLSDLVHARVAAHAADMEMLARLEGLHGETWWPERAGKTQEMLEAITDRIPEVAGKGMAQAESQAWLTRLAADQALAEPRVKVEDTVEVDGYPDMWQVISRLEGKLPGYGHEAFMRAVAEALPWVQVERMEIAEGSTPRVVVTFRSYYRKAPPTADAPSHPATDKQEPTPNPDAADLAR